MNQTKNEKLPLLLLVLGVAAAAVRGLLYLTAVDGKGMLIRGHFLGILLMILCAAAVLSVLYVIRLKGSDAFSDNFRPSTPAAVGCAVMAAGVLLTLLTGNAMPRPRLVQLWYLSGILSVAGLIWAGLSRYRGQQPFMLCYGVLTVFLALHMVSRYQPWSGDPQSQDWIFSLLGAIGLTLCSYGNSAFCVDKGKRRSFLATSLLTVFACCAALTHTEYFWLYLGGGIWAFTGICRVTPVPLPESAPETE